MGLKVCKFGGTSMAKAEAINNVCDIILSDKERKFVIVSAPGKRFKEDEKITDLLYRCSDEFKNGGDFDTTFTKIKDRYTEIVADLKLDLDIDSILKETENRIKQLDGDREFCASRGEYLNAIIMAKRLNFTFVDAENIIMFDEDGKFNPEFTNDICSKALSKIKKAVIPGFFGKDVNGNIRTFSRGGSDITGSIIARAVNASIYENWTDVNGFMVCDPRIVDNPKQIEVLSYRELRELSYMGASVLHADAIFPVSKSDIPINIKNTFDPTNKGTMILPNDQCLNTGNLITGIAGRKDFTAIIIEKSMMNLELGFARKVLSILEHYGVSFEHMPSGIDTLSIVIASESLKNGKLDKIIEKITASVDPDNIHIQEEISLIATVGHGMASMIGTAARLCKALADAKINIKMIDQGSSELNIIIGVLNKDYEASIKAIYNEFCR